MLSPPAGLMMDASRHLKHNDITVISVTHSDSLFLSGVSSHM
jgi:hypothetical protein